MFCTKCWHKNDENTNFCVNCWNKLQETPEIQQSEKINSSKNDYLKIFFDFIENRNYLLFGGIIAIIIWYFFPIKFFWQANWRFFSEELSLLNASLVFAVFLVIFWLQRLTKIRSWVSDWLSFFFAVLLFYFIYYPTKIAWIFIKITTDLTKNFENLQVAYDIKIAYFSLLILFLIALFSAYNILKDLKVFDELKFKEKLWMKN